MDIVLIGSGNVAQVLGQRMGLSGHKIRQVISRQKAHAGALAKRLQASYTDDLTEIDMNADVYLLAVSDAAISQLNDTLRLGSCIVAHTAASVDLAAISQISTHTGVFYPLQSLHKEFPLVHPIPILLEANREEVRRRLRTLAESISPKVLETDAAQRFRLHVTAVFCNNFTNHLVTRAQQFCIHEGLDFELLQPLLRETFFRLERHEPTAVQTGPAIRGDKGTIQKQESLLQTYPDLLRIYQVLSADIYQYYQSIHKKNG